MENAKGYFKSFVNDKEQFKNELERLQASFQAGWPDLKLTSVALCGQMLITIIYNQLLLEALSYHDTNLAPVFCAQYDYAVGLRGIGFDLFRADVASKNTDTQKNAHDLKEAFELTKQLPSVDDLLEAYESLQTVVGELSASLFWNGCAK